MGQGPVELLRSVPLFSDLEEGELERFSRVAVARSFPAGTRVFHEGDHSDACYIVRDGSFRVTREHSDGRAITLATLGSGDIYEFYCTNNKELEELQKLRELELKKP